MTSETKKRILICLLLLTAVLLLKFFLPGPGACVGDWISGMKNPAVSRAVFAFYDRLSAGEHISSAMEVFHEEQP